MTGLCCRCQVRHDDDLCCRHGVICHGDVAGPVEILRADDGVSDVVAVVAGSVVFGIVVAASLWLGMNGSATAKFAAAVALLVIVAPVLWRLLVDDLNDHNPRRSPHEPKEQ